MAATAPHRSETGASSRANARRKSPQLPVARVLAGFVWGLMTSARPDSAEAAMALSDRRVVDLRSSSARQMSRLSTFSIAVASAAPKGVAFEIVRRCISARSHLGPSLRSAEEAGVA
jgi:hypothetical protein